MEETLKQVTVSCYYDPEADALYITIGDPSEVEETVEISEGLLACSDKQGRLRGLTILHVTQPNRVKAPEVFLPLQEVTERVIKAFEPFEQIRAIFDEQWVIGKAQQTFAVSISRLPLILQWALLPTTPNPALKALEENLSILRQVKGWEHKVKQLRTGDDRQFWATLAELYLAAHFQRLGATVTEFDPPVWGEKKADFTFAVTVDGSMQKGFVEVHTAIPEDKMPTQKAPIAIEPLECLEDPLKRVLKPLKNKVEQLPQWSELNYLRVFAECVNLYPTEEQLPLVVQRLREMMGWGEESEILQEAFSKGVDAVVLFAINPLFKLLWSIQWYWRPDLRALSQRHPLFRDYPLKKVPSNQNELAEVVLDYIRRGLVTCEEAAEMLRLTPEQVCQLLERE